jgi:hypothetical protein
MSIAFLNPLFLFGLAAGIIPIIIHRLVQRHGRVKKFSAVRLLLQSQQNLVRPERLKQLILLALRVLAVTSLALLMARPVWLYPGVFSSGEEGAKVVVLDNSMSMGYREDRGERFELAKKKAREILEGITGRVLILPTSNLLEKIAPGRSLEWMDPERALKELEALSLFFGKGDPVGALNLASREWRDSRGPVEFVILTDLARGDWEGFRLSELKNVPADLSVTFIRFGGEGLDGNWAVKDAKLSQGEGVVGALSRLEVTVGNLSDQANSTIVQLYLNDTKVEQKTIDFKAGDEGKVSFDLFLDRSGWVQGEVRLAGDRLPIDDHFYFSLKAREKIRVLVVDGDPRPSLKGSESYYLVNALQPGGGEGSPFLTRVISEGELERIDLKPFEALFLLNVSQPPSGPLASFLQAGKPLFIFLGSRTNPDYYQRLPFFSWQLKEVKERLQGAARIGPVDSTLKPLRNLAGISVESLRKASFYRYYPVERSAKNLLVLENRDPLLVEGEWGKGWVFLYASSADLDWNDLPLNAAYVPWIQGLLKEAVGLSSDPLLPGLRIGEPFPEKIPGSQILGIPAGPGIYRFLLPEGDILHGVNPPLEESDLGKVTPEELQKRFGSVKVRVVESREGAPGVPLAGRRELWPYILGFLLILLGVEMGVASRL